jgi:hypothetical protein
MPDEVEIRSRPTASASAPGSRRSRAGRRRSAEVVRGERLPTATRTINTRVAPGRRTPLRGLAFAGADCVHNLRDTLARQGWRSSSRTGRSKAFPNPAVVKNKASDLHLSAGLPPMIRVTATCAASTCRRSSTRTCTDDYDIMNDGSEDPEELE